MRKIKLRTDEAALVEAVANGDESAERSLYHYCRRYFFSHYHSVFFSGEYDAEDIFQDAYILVWQKICRGGIRSVEGHLTDSYGRPYEGRLTTYLMNVARNKYMEQVRKLRKERDATQGTLAATDTDEGTDDDELRREAVAESVGMMTEQCAGIIRMFYIEEKPLDEILSLLPTYNSKDALKTAKNKCLNRLRKAACLLYKNLRKE